MGRRVVEVLERTAAMAHTYERACLASPGCACDVLTSWVDSKGSPLPSWGRC